MASQQTIKKSPAAPPCGRDSNEGKSTVESHQCNGSSMAPPFSRSRTWGQSVMVVPEPVRRGAGVVKCKSKPFNHIIVSRNWGLLLVVAQSETSCLLDQHSHSDFFQLSVIHANLLQKKKKRMWWRGYPGECQNFKCYFGQNMIEKYQIVSTLEYINSRLPKHIASNPILNKALTSSANAGKCPLILEILLKKTSLCIILIFLTKTSKFNATIQSCSQSFLAMIPRSSSHMVSPFEMKNLSNEKTKALRCLKKFLIYIFYITYT